MTVRRSLTSTPAICSHDVGRTTAGDCPYQLNYYPYLTDFIWASILKYFRINISVISLPGFPGLLVMGHTQ